MNEYSEYLYIDNKSWLGWNNSTKYFNEHSHKQIFIERNIVLAIKQKPATIMIDGVKYDKQSVMNAIKNFEITE